MIARCPKNPKHKEFVTTIHVAQDAVVDEHGDFLRNPRNMEVQTTHGPDPGNIWTCKECGTQAEVSAAESFPAPALPPYEGVVKATGKYVRVCLEWIGEGDLGDYNPEDPQDTPLLRMDVQRRGRHGGEEVRGRQWGNIRNGSFCTLIDARKTKEEIKAIAEKAVCLLDRFGTEPIPHVELLSWVENADTIGTLIYKDRNCLVMRSAK